MTRPFRQAILDALPRGGIGVEVGVFRGDFSAELLTTEPARLVLIDPWESVSDDRRLNAWYGAARRSQAEMDQIHADVADRFRAELAAGQVVIRRDYSASALAALPDGSLDWIYIDGDHRYDAVSEDLRLALAKVHAGGLICCDDYIDAGWFGDDVIRAVDDFRREAPNAVEVAFVAGPKIALRRTR